MSTLVAIGYPDETTAAAAAEEARRLAGDLVIEPEAIAVISRSRDGRFQVNTNHHPVAGRSRSCRRRCTAGPSLPPSPDRVRTC